MLRQVRFELYKMARRPRSYIGFAAFALITFFTMLGLKYGHFTDMSGFQVSRQGFSMVGDVANGEMLSWMVVASPLSVPVLTMFMPFFVCLVFGEVVAGESADATLRTLLARPIRRTSVFTAKVVASLIYALALVYSLGISGYLLGIAALGRGGLLATGTFRSPMLVWFSEGEGLVRLALGYGLTFAAVVTVGMVAFFISTWLNNALGAIGGAIGLLFTMLIVGEIPYFKPVAEYLFSTHLFVGQKAFLRPIPWPEIWHSLACLGAYSVVSFVASMVIFRRKDILT